MVPSTVRRLLAALGGLLLALTLAGGAHAGGWSVVVLDADSALLGVDGGLVAGEPVAVGFTVLQHGDKPLDGLSPIVTVVADATGAATTFRARADGEPGHYLVELMLPEAGTYSWEIDAYGPPSALAPLTVEVAPAPAPEPAQAPAPSPAAALLLWLAIPAALIGAVMLLARARRRPAGAL